MTANILVTSPYQPFTLPNQFKAVFNGSVYVGVADMDPQVNQVPVFVENEDGTQVQVSQPIKTNAGGYLSYNGSPAKFVTTGNYSIKVLSSLGSLIWYESNIFKYDPTKLQDDINKGVGKESVCYLSVWGDDASAKVNSQIYPFKTIGAALAATTGNVTLRLGTGSFEWIGGLRSGVAVIGSGEPYVDAASQSMVGGTVLYTSGPGGFPGGVGLMRGITFKNLGVFAKGKTDGLIIAGPAGTGTASGISIENVTTLADETSNHSCLVENVENLSITNLTTYGGVSGLAVKAVNFTISDTKHYDASGAYMTLRESPYAMCRNGAVTNVVGQHKNRTTDTSAGVQFLNNEEGCEMQSIQVSNISVSGVGTGVYFDNQINTKSGTAVTVSDATVYGSSDFAYTINGNAKSVKFENITASNCTATAKLSASGAYAPTDCEISGINIIAGPKSVARPILNEGVRTSISGVKVNKYGMDTFSPVVENPGADLVLSGIQYSGSIVIDTGSGYHSIVEGERLTGTTGGTSTNGKAIAVKRMDGSMSVSIRNIVASAATSVISLPANMSFKDGDSASPAQIRQNYSVTMNGYINASTPTAADIKLIAFPLTKSTFQVNITADPGIITNGVVISCELSGVWK